MTDGMPLPADPCEMGRQRIIPSRSDLDLCNFYPQNPLRPVRRTALDLSVGNHGLSVVCLQHLGNKRFTSWNEWFESIPEFVYDNHLLRLARYFGFEAINGSFTRRPHSYQQIAYTKDEKTMTRFGHADIQIVGLPISVTSNISTMSSTRENDNHEEHMEEEPATISDNRFVNLYII